jgi:DNA polymerase-3 subunit delta
MTEQSRIFLIKGDDPTLVYEARSNILDELLPDSSRMTSVEELDASETSVDAVVEACQTPSLFGDLRIVIVRNIGAFKSGDVDQLVDFVSEPLDTTALICISGGGQIPKRLSDVIRKNGNVIDASVPTGRARNTWFNEQIRDLPVKFEPEAREILVEHLGEDVSRLFGLADALATTYGVDSKIDAKQLMPFLGEAGSVAPWDLTDAIDRGDIDSALHQLHRMMHAGERHSLVVLAILYRHFRAMLALDGDPPVSEHEAAQRLGMSPYPAKKAMLQSEKLGHNALTQAIELLAKADDDLRGGSGLEDEAVVEVLVARLARLSKQSAASRTSQKSRSNIRQARAVLHS